MPPFCFLSRTCGYVRDLAALDSLIHESQATRTPLPAAETPVHGASHPVHEFVKRSSSSSAGVAVGVSVAAIFVVVFVVGICWRRTSQAAVEAQLARQRRRSGKGSGGKGTHGHKGRTHGVSRNRISRAAGSRRASCEVEDTVDKCCVEGAAGLQTPPRSHSSFSRRSHQRRRHRSSTASDSPLSVLSLIRDMPDLLPGGAHEDGSPPPPPQQQQAALGHGAVYNEMDAPQHDEVYEVPAAAPARPGRRAAGDLAKFGLLDHLAAGMIQQKEIREKREKKANKANKEKKERKKRQEDERRERVRRQRDSQGRGPRR